MNSKEIIEEQLAYIEYVNVLTPGMDGTCRDCDGSPEAHEQGRIDHTECSWVAINEAVKKIREELGEES